MRKILQVTGADLSPKAKDVRYDEIRIEDLNASAFQEALISDLVTFHANGCIYTLKER